jgi:hypothetical protein
MTVSSVSRTTFLVLFALLAALTSGLVVLFDSSGLAPYSHSVSVGASLFTFVGVGIGIVMYRKGVLQNIGNRRHTFSVFVACGFILGNRVLGWLQDGQLSDILTADMWLISALAAMAGVTVNRAIFVCSVISAMFAASAVVAPDYALELFSLLVPTNVSILAVSSWFWTRATAK